MRKIIRRRFTVDFLKVLAGKECVVQKSQVIGNGLPDDAQMIHLSFDEKTNCIDMFFISEKEGVCIEEGRSIYDVEPSSPTFERIDTFDKDYVKTKIDDCLIVFKMIKDYETDPDCDAQDEDYIEVLQKLKERLGL